MTTAGVLEGMGIVPVVTPLDVADAPDLGAAIVAGGLRCVEVTLRSPAGLPTIAALAGTAGLMVGAGTVLTLEQVDRVADAGASFVVSPGLDPGVVDRIQDRGLLPLPGVATATEVQRAVGLGLDALKFFPADALGGLPTIAALAAPFAGVRFVPSGGVSDANCAEYAAHPAVLAVSGSWVCPGEALRDRDWDRVAELSRRAVDLLDGRVP